VAGILCGPWGAVEEAAEAGAVTIFNDVLYGADLTALFLRPTGFLEKQRNSSSGSPAAVYESYPWLNPRVGMDQFEARLDIVEGVVPSSGASATWIPITQTPAWGWISGGGQAQSGKVDLTIRKIGTAEQLTARYEWFLFGDSINSGNNGGTIYTNNNGFISPDSSV
jgi:hypothetical protein